MLYRSINVFGEQTQVFTDREAALAAFESGAVPNVYHNDRELTQPRWCDRAQKFIKPALAECVSRDVI